MKHWNAILFTGLIWFFVGAMLMMKGLKLIVLGVPQVDWLVSIVGSAQQASLLLIVKALIVGYIKGKYVLTKTVMRVTKRVLSLAVPIKLSQIYAKGYYILLGSMVCLGVLLKILAIPPALLGFIDLAIGSALIHGAMMYFRISWQCRAEKASS